VEDATRELDRVAVGEDLLAAGAAARAASATHPATEEL
jgi:hypothetical protein